MLAAHSITTFKLAILHDDDDNNELTTLRCQETQETLREKKQTHQIQAEILCTDFEIS